MRFVPRLRPSSYNHLFTRVFVNNVSAKLELTFLPDDFNFSCKKRGELGKLLCDILIVINTESAN